VIVTLSVRTPATNAPDVVGARDPLFVARVTVPVKPVTVELSCACAVIVTLNAVPECWVAIALKVKWSRGFAESCAEFWLSQFAPFAS
jgi:hypothetical protein